MGARKYRKKYSEEKQIRDMSSSLSAAVRGRDAETILSFYSDEVVYYDVRDALRTNKEGIKASWQECFASSREFGYDVQDIQVRCEEKTAFSFCLSHSTGTTNDGDAIDIWLRVTTCFKKEDELWLIIHEHVSVPGDLLTGKILPNLKPRKMWLL